MEVITTHLNADFDAFGSMVAARRLYPNAVVAFPGSQEKSLRDFFMESTLYILSIEKAKDIELDKVRKLILVDTRQKGRIGRFAALADADDVEIHVYDHHPDSDDDIAGDPEVVEEVGATVTLLLREIKERGIDLNAEEATVMALGLYEDTGSFTFSSTTGEDLEAAAWLVERGANLRIIADMMTGDLTTDQIELLHQLIEESQTIVIGGVEIVVSTAGAHGYVGDVALLIHKYQEMENLDALFALVRMEDRVHLIARSRLDEVNAGEIAGEFGGGGHATAASATIRDLSLYEARERLIRQIHERTRPKREAGEIMSRPVVTIGPENDLDYAAELLERYQISSLPVVSDGSIHGILHRNAIEKARRHGLEESTVGDFMDAPVISVNAGDPIDKVIHISLEAGVRLVPVLEGGRLVGVVSRSDLLGHLKIPRDKDTGGPDEFQTGRPRTKNIKRLIDERLPKNVVQILRRCGEIASARTEEVYLVGGAVRDLLMRNRNLDIDLVVEGNGIEFARAVAAEYPGSRVRDHEKFGTAVVLFEDGFKIDTATARHEYYDRPGALPTVETSSIKRDLYRRDFTMNTLAVSLNPGQWGRVIDFFGGSRDIKDKAIRILHNLAFVEDPTRILRAVRFSSRFGFTIGKHTLNLMKRAVKMKIFDRVQGKRLLNELIHILEEKTPLPALELMDEFGIFEALHPRLAYGQKTRDLVDAVSGVLSWWRYLYEGDDLEPWLVYFLALTDPIRDKDLESVMDRFNFSPGQRKRVLGERAPMRRALAELAKGATDRPSRIVRALQGLSMESLLFMMARTAREDTRRAVSDYITEFRHVRSILKGRHLKEMGYAPGPKFGEILQFLREARLDGLVRTIGDERALALKTFPLDDPPPSTTKRAIRSEIISE